MALKVLIVKITIVDYPSQVADKTQVERAITQSEESSLEMEMLRHTQSKSDLENAERMMEEAALVQSKKEIEDIEVDPSWEVEQAILIESQKEYLEHLYNNNQKSNTDKT